MELVLNAAQFLDSLLHSNKLSAKDSALNSGLLLAVPLDHGHVHEYHEASLGPAVRLIARVVRIYEHTKSNLSPKRLRSVGRQGLLDVAIKGRPILFGLEL